MYQTSMYHKFVKELSEFCLIYLPLGQKIDDKLKCQKPLLAEAC